MHKNIGLFFGSFNPIHIGHLLLATHMREAAALDEVWFIVSPQNPFKKSSELADEQHRLEMVKLATEKVEYFKVSDIEFQLEKPSYTHITLKALSKKYPEHTFKLIIGEDNVAKFYEWKEADWILENYKVLVYRRQVDHRKNTRCTTYNIRLTHV
jgi:nicotinate-nucleotide adenylyltransferase